jgi:hypothetical protein
MRAKNVAASALIQRTLKLLSLLLIGQSFLGMAGRHADHPLREELSVAI